MTLKSPAIVGFCGLLSGTVLCAGFAGGAAQQTPPVQTLPATQPATQPATAPAADLPPAEQLIELFITALGGRENLTAIDSTAILATATTPTGESSMDMKCDDRGAFLLKLESPEGSGLVGSDGELGWRRNAMGYHLVPKEQVQEVRKELYLYMYRIVADPSAFFQTMHTIGREPVDGKDAFKLRMTFKDQPEQEQLWWLSVEDHLILKVERTVGEVPSTMLFSEWKKFEKPALNLYTKLTLQQQEIDASIVYNQVHFNNVDPAEFAVPQDVKDLVNFRDTPATAPSTQPSTQPTQPATTNPAE